MWPQRFGVLDRKQPAAAGRPEAVSGRKATPDLNDTQFWAGGVETAMFHGLQAITQWVQSDAAVGTAAAIKWPLFSGARRNFLAFAVKWKSVRMSCRILLEAAAFPQVNWGDFKGTAGRVNMLLGFDNLEIFPMEVDRKDYLML